MPFKIYYILALIFALVSGYSHSQTEAEMKVQADKLFNNGQFIEATPLYMHLLSLQPRDYTYNYKYGACLTYNSNRKQEAIKYLAFATGDPSTPPETYYYLGKALHLNYQFNEAIKNYTLYIQKNTSGSKKFDAEREIQMCQNGKRLMTTISDIIVMDKKEITSDKFFRIYELKDIGGNLLVTAEFQSKLDKKNNHTPLIHFPQNPSVIYYSSYGENGATGKDIYVRKKLPDGSWGQPQAVQGSVNTNEDEDFPYMHPDGNYLYFSSKGHNSMGGYDVFRSKYDPQTNSYGPPENMDFAISSPDDDLFYVVDSLNKDAYFASARQSEKGKLYVYKVKVDRVSLQLAVIKGNFVSEVNPNIKRINFQVKDYASGDDIGKFSSNDKASYLITFPKGGKYEYVMSIEGSTQEFRSVVTIPFMKEFKPLKQKIIHTMEDGKEVIKIINLFNEEVDDPAAVIAEVVKMRSELNVNVNEFNLEELEKEKQSKQVLVELGLGDMRLIEVSNVLNNEVKKGEENRQLIENIENNVNNLIVENAEEHKRLEEEIKQNVAEANKAEGNDSKYLLLKEAENMIKQQEELKLYSKNLIRLNDSVKGVLAGSMSQNEQQQLSNLATNFEQLVKDGKNTEALELLNENKEVVKKSLSDNSMDLVQNLVDKVVKIDDEINTQKAKVDKYNRDLSDLDIEILSLQNSIYSAKKKDVPAMEAKIASKKEEIKLIQGERDAVQKIVDKKIEEKYKLNKQIEILQDAISNKSVVAVSKDKALAALKETEKTNSNTINAYVEQQINELEKIDPTLKDRVVVSSGLSAQNIYSEYKLSESGIDSDSKLSKEDKLYKHVANERKTLKQLEARLNEIEKLLSENKVDDKLNKEKQAIAAYLKEIEAQNAIHEKQIENLVAQNGAGDPEEVIKDLLPEYESNLESVEANTNLSDSEKLKELNKEDTKLLNLVEQELKKVDAQLIKEPNNTEIKKKQQTLNQIKQQTETSIDKRNELLNKETSSTELTRESVLEKIDPAYSKEISVIEKDPSKSQKEKLEALNELDKVLLAKIDNGLELVENQLKSNPNDAALKQEQTLLKQLQTDKENSISQRNVELSKESATTSTLTADQLLMQIDPTYSSDVETIKSNSALKEDQKLTGLMVRDEDLLSIIRLKITETEKELASNPSNADAKRKLELLKDLENKTDQNILSIQREISEIASTNSNEGNELIKKIDPEYTSEVEKINDNNSLSDKEKLTQLQLKDQELLKTIDSEIKAIDKKIAKDPENKDLISQKDNLDNLKSIIEEKTEERNQIINSKVSSELTKENISAKKEELRTELDPSYASKKDQILKSNQNAVDKLKKELALEESILDKIEAKENSIKKTLEKDPLNNGLKTELLILEELKKETNSNIDILKDAIKNKGEISITEESKETLNKEIDPEYLDKIKSIENSSELSELEKLTQLKEIKEEHKEKLDQALQESKVEANQNPNNKEVEAKNNAIVNLQSDNEKDIEEIEEKISELEANKFIASTDEKNRMIKTLRPEYDESVAGIESQNINSELEKLKLLQEEDQKLLGSVYNKLEQVEEQLKEDPKSSELQNELRILNALAKDLESKIELRQAEINNKENLNSISESDKNNEIQKIDPTYLSDLNSIEKLELSEKETLEKQIAAQQDLLSKVNEELKKLEGQLKDDPSNQQLLDHQKILNAIKADLISSLETKNEKIKTLGKTSAVVSKSDLDPRYEDKKNDILSDNSLSEQEKNQDLLKLENEMLEMAQDKQLEAKQQLDKDPSNEEFIRENDKYSNLVSEIEKEVRKIKSNITEPVSLELTAEKKDQLIADVLLDYKDRKSNLSTSKMEESKKVSEQLKLENELRTKLISEQKSIEKSLDKDPGNTELITKLDHIKELIRQQDEEINRLKEYQNSLQQKAESEEIISKVDNSYQEDIEKLNESTSETKTNELIDREKAHQDKIEDRIAEVEKSIEKKSTPELEAENQILKNELAESKERENELRASSSETKEKSNEEIRFVENLREDLLKANSGIVNEERAEIDGLKEQDRILDSYISELKELIGEQEKNVAENPQNHEAQNKLDWLEDELQTAQTKQRKVKITIGELEKLSVENNNTFDSKFDDPELNKINAKESELQKELTNSNLDQKEKAQLEKELNQVQKEKTLVENRLMSAEISENKEKNTEQLNEIKSTSGTNEETKVNSELAINQEKQLTKEADKLIEEANSTKNSEEKNYLLEKALANQEKASEGISEALVENKIEELEAANGISSLETTEELEKKKRRYVIQVGELTQLIDEKDEELKTAKSKDAARLNEEKSSLSEQKTLLEKKIAIVDQEIANRQNEQKESTIDRQAIETEVTVTEEKTIAMSDAYQKYNEKANEALNLEKEISSLEAQINTEKADSKTLISENIQNPNEETKSRLDQKLKTIKELEDELASKNAALKLKQQEANENLPSNKEEAMKFQNFVKRGVQPIQKAAVVASLIQMPASGLAIDENGNSPYSANNPIPVDVKNPSGLVYRVQVGAFAKPIPQDLFKEFNPVSGEKLNNGITRYLAGYFNNSTKVVEARDQIKNLGYGDAFAVAYCDGKRITLAEARILEAKGQCKAKGENELIMEVAESTAITTGKIDSTGNVSAEIIKQQENEPTYHLAPDAAKAEPVEKHPGLFYTVQVGVFNKPVNEGTVKGMSPLMTSRLPNGQIRYSAGMYNSVDEARPKKQEAIDRGVKDAFITAYYNGERINLAEAEKILAEKGVAVLENNRLKTSGNAAIEEKVETEKMETVETEKVETTITETEIKTERYQIITKKSFEEFPREVLNRYNSHGSFYYDEADKKVKSAVYSSEDQLPQVYYFKDDIDTLKWTVDANAKASIFCVTFAKNSLPGDFTDWLLRFNYRREFVEKEGEIKMRLFGVPEERVGEMEAKLNQFGLTYTVETKTEIELETEEK